MGNLRDKKIRQIRSWSLDSDVPSIPDQDYDVIFPITVYDAVFRTSDEDSTNLTSELKAIYSLIDEKQDAIYGGHAGNLMTWTGTKGYIGETEVSRVIPADPTQLSNGRIPTEKAVGNALNLKTDLSAYNNHVSDTDIHITAAERARWNASANIDAFREHTSDSTSHITAEERESWNAKTDKSEFDRHLMNKANPHSVTAHQINAYTRSEVDELFRNIRESFFNYKNISYDSRRDIATLVEYDPELWNPNFVLGYGDDLPDISGLDSNLTYFALRPATDFSVNETSECTIWMKKPGLSWQNIGLVTMSLGDMVIRYPDTVMCVWIEGRFINLFTGSTAVGSTNTAETTALVWKPKIEVIDGMQYLAFTLSAETQAPDLINVGTPGYTPIKGVDYFDGAPGLGVPAGGSINDIMIKSTSEDYDVEWTSFENFLTQYVNEGGVIPAATPNWSTIIGKPTIFQEKGEDDFGLMSQKAISRELTSISNSITEILNTIHDTSGIAGLTDLIQNHINDHNNPHNLTPASIGATSHSDFLEHTQNQNNPHAVTAEQIGLGNVDNTRDIDKPISNQVQAVIDIMNSKIDEFNSALNGNELISKIIWNDATCDITIQYRDDSVLNIHIPVIDIMETISYDENSAELILTLPNSNVHRVPIRQVVKTYTGTQSQHIDVDVDESGVIHAEILPGTIDGESIVENVHLRGNPTAEVQSIYDKSNRIATTRFTKEIVIDNVESTEQDRPLSANQGRILNLSKTSRSEVLQMIADSPLLNVVDSLGVEDPNAVLSANMGAELFKTKAPMVHTSASGSAFGRATVDLFGHVRSANTNPLMDGTVFIGTDDGYFSRADHRHPTDITRAPVNWPDTANGIYRFTGEPRAALPPLDDVSDRIATTEWVVNYLRSVPLTEDQLNTIVERVVARIAANNT